MISMADAYRPGPDGVVDTSPGSLFDQYSKQQAAFNANMSVAPGNPTLTMGQQYMAANPDVQQDAIARANAEGLTGGDAFSNRLDEIAFEHFNAYGRPEGRSGFGYTAPNPNSFAPSPTDGMPFTPGSGSGSMPGGGFGAGQPTSGGPAFTQPTFDFSSFNDSLNTALGNFNGLLDSYDSMLGGLFDTTNQVPSYGGGFLPFPTTLQGGFGPFGAPFFGGVGTGFNTGFGGNFNQPVQSASPTTSSGPGFGGFGGGVAGTGHRQFFTI